MKPEKKVDVFCNSSLVITKPRSIFPGNLYVNGSISLGYQKVIPSRIEVYGDLIVDGYIDVDELVVHGSLICEVLDCEDCSVSEDIIANGSILVYSDSRMSDAKNTITSEHGHIITSGELEALRVIAKEGSIEAGSIIAAEIMAFDEVISQNYISDFSTLFAGEKVIAGGHIISSYDNKPQINILRGGIESHGFILD